MIHTALTAEEEIRRIRGLATARKEAPVFGDRREVPMFWDHPDSPARRGLAEVLAFRDVLATAPPRPTLVAQAWAGLAALARRLGCAPGNAVVGRAVPATESPGAK